LEKIAIKNVIFIFLIQNWRTGGQNRSSLGGVGTNGKVEGKNGVGG
jgi:hypothetical protein